MKFVVRVKFRDWNIEDFEAVSDRTVAAAGLDENGGSGGQRMDLVIELDVTFPFENVIHLGHFGMIVLFAILLDLNEMHRGDLVLVVHESTPRLTTGAGRGLNLREPGDLKILFDHFVFHVIVYAWRKGFEREAFDMFPPWPLFDHDFPNSHFSSHPFLSHPVGSREL